MTLIICGLAEAPAIIAARAPSHMVTLLDAASMIETPAGLPPDHHLRLSVNDIAEPTEGLILPSADLVHRLLAFGRAWDARTPMIVHCWAGISRSSARCFWVRRYASLSCSSSAPVSGAERGTDIPSMKVSGSCPQLMPNMPAGSP